MGFASRIIRATRVSKWRLDVGTCSPPMLVMIETLGASGYVVPPPVAHAEGSDRIRIANRIRATRVSKWRLDVGTCSPPMLVMIETLGASGYVVPPPVAHA
jgi:hypothetical protein